MTGPMSSHMVASLPMYAANPEALAAFWTAIAMALRARGMAGVPDVLAMPDVLESHWRRPDLLMSQTCGYPLVTALAEEVRVAGAFHYEAPGCEGPCYRSWLIARRDDAGSELGHFAGRRVAFNGRNSQSGYNSLRALVAPLNRGGHFFNAAIETGAHMASMRAVAEGTADIAAIDCVSFAVISAADKDLAEALKIVGETASAPGLPLIMGGTATDEDFLILRETLAEVCADPALEAVRAQLMIAGFAPLDLADYDEIHAMERLAIAAGYPELG
jgi:ABC-type phosphate/phosphonate transport system substrate-binding protein